MAIQIRVRRYQQFGKLAGRFRRAADGDLQRDAQDELQKAAGPVLKTVQSAVLKGNYPDPHPAAAQIRPIPKPPLRAGLAAATRTRPIPTGVQFHIHGPAVGRGKWGLRLAELTDTEEAPRWRHPVFGERQRPWRDQVGKPWFYVTIRAGKPVFQTGVQRAMSKTARKIMG